MPIDIVLSIYLVLSREIDRNFGNFSKRMNWIRIIDKAEEVVSQKGGGKADLAKILGVRPQYLSDIRSGKSKNPGSDFALALINKVGLNPEWLETGEGTPFIKQGIGVSLAPPGVLGVAPPGAVLGAGPPSAVLGAAPPAQKPIGAAGPNANPDSHLGDAPVPALTHAKIPLLKQRVSCGPGENWEQGDNIEKYLDINTLIPRLGIGRLVAFKARGSSMLGAGIRGGDYILFDASADEVFTDGVYIFMLDGDVFCKRLEFDDLTKIIKIFSVRVADLEKAELAKTINTGDPDFTDRFRIFGRVKTCIRPLEKEE